jgi:hypothetical protein
MTPGEGEYISIFMTLFFADTELLSTLNFYTFLSTLNFYIF